MRTRWTSGWRVVAVGWVVAFAAACTPLPYMENPPPPPPPSFDITLRWSGSPTSTQRSLTDAAAARWEEIVVGDVPSTTLNIAAGNCGSGVPSFAGTVDDVLVDVRVAPIDGVGGVLGNSGPCFVRNSDLLPGYGVIILDSADAAQLVTAGTFGSVVTHELGHLLGFGTLWSLGRSFVSGAETSNPTYSGARAKAEYVALGRSGNVPLENTGGAGTADSHWRESVFDTEMMSGYLDPTNKISRITVAALEDLGYSVNYSAADPYSLPASGGTAALRVDPGSLGEMQPIPLRGVIPGS